LIGKKNDKRTDLSPTAAVEQNLYSDGEKSSESYSGSQFLALKSPSKREDLNHHDLQQLSHGSKNNKDENCCQGGEERKNSIKIGKRQSRSKLPRQRPHRSAQHQTNGQVDLPAEIKVNINSKLFMKKIKLSFSRHKYKQFKMVINKQNVHHDYHTKTTVQRLLAILINYNLIFTHRIILINPMFPIPIILPL
jgi:hypothetical protein